MPSIEVTMYDIAGADDLWAMFGRMVALGWRGSVKNAPSVSDPQESEDPLPAVWSLDAYTDDAAAATGVRHLHVEVGWLVVVLGNTIEAGPGADLRARYGLE